MEDFNFGSVNKPFNWWYLEYLKECEIKYSFEALFDLNKNQENSLEESKKKIEEYLRLTPREERNDELVHEAENTIEELQRLQRYSMIMAIFSLYESRLKSICQLINEKNNFGKIIERGWYTKHSTDFFKETLKIDIEQIECFSKISDCRQIRNVIAHNEGILDEAIRNTLKEENGICFKYCVNDDGNNSEKRPNEYLIIVEKDIYIKDLLGTIKSFFEILLLEVDIRQSEIDKLNSEC